MEQENADYNVKLRKNILKTVLIIYLVVAIIYLTIKYHENLPSMSASNIKEPMIWKKMLVIGDTNVQLGFHDNHNWLGFLADKLTRECDVLNRGFDGYNSRYVRLILPKIMNEFKQKRKNYLAGVILFLGIYDSVKQDTQQHVSLKKYADNYQFIIDYIINSTGITQNRIIIITPPKISNEKVAEFRNVNVSETSFSDHMVKKYAHKTKEIALANKIPCIDLYEMMELSKSNTRDYFYYDGLTLSSLGTRLFFQKLWDKVYEQFVMTNILRHNFPEYYQIEYKKDLKILPQ